MPIRDDLLSFTYQQSVAANANATTVLTDVVQNPQYTDHKGNAGYEPPNVGMKMCWNCIVDGEDLLAAVDGSVLTFSLYEDDEETPTTGGTAILTKAITENTPTEHPQGTVLFSIPLPVDAIKKYLGVACAITTQNLSTGKVTSWIGPPIMQK